MVCTYSGPLTAIRYPLVVVILSQPEGRAKDLLFVVRSRPWRKESRSFAPAVGGYPAALPQDDS